MQSAIPEAIITMIVSILCAIFVVMINSLARTGIQEGNTVNSTASKIISDFCNYDISRLDTKTVSGSEIVRLVEQYKDVYTLEYKYLDSGIANLKKVTDTAMFDTDHWYRLSITYDQNDNVAKITIIQTNE